MAEVEQTTYRRYRFNVKQYYALAEAGILAPDEHVELLDGRIYIMSPVGSLHAACVDRLNQWLNRHVAGQAIVRIQSPIHLGGRTEPEPDVALLKQRDDFYAHAHPTPADVLLAIEVADTTLATDRTIKLPLYARHGINTTWIVNLPDSCVEIYSEPAPEGYRRSERRRRSQTLDVPAFPDLWLSVDDVLG